MVWQRKTENFLEGVVPHSTGCPRIVAGYHGKARGHVLRILHLKPADSTYPVATHPLQTRHWRDGLVSRVLYPKPEEPNNADAHHVKLLLKNMIRSPEKE